MVPEYTEYVIINLHYEKGREKPLIVTKIGDAPPPDLKSWLTFCFYTEQHYLELYNCPEKIKFREWEITTGDENLFKMYGTYEEVNILLGYEKWHWTFYTENKGQSSGVYNIPYQYCGCCISDRYKEIVEKIQNYKHK